MQLLTAVNQILSTLGESQVSSIDSQHSTVYKILTSIELQKQLLLERGWWFNTGTQTMYLNIQNQLEAPTNTLSVKDTSNKYLLTVRDDMLYDASNNTQYFTEPVEIFCTFNLAFEDLPISAAAIVLDKAKIDVYTDTLGVDSVIEVIHAHLAEHTRELERQHIRMMKHSSKNRPAWARYQNALRG